MSIIESSANTLVRFTGLGIICFNETQNRGEIAILRDERHTLSLRIQQPQYLDGAEKDVIVYKNLAVYENLPKECVEIEIKAIENPTIFGFQIYKADENFNRVDSLDVNDFRWIVDFDEFHRDGLVTQSDEDRYPVTRLFIGNGLFYTHKLDTELYFEKIRKDKNNGLINREVFGNVAETIGVKIEAELVSFRIKYDEVDETRLLEKVNGLPYRIEILNMDYNENADYSDMPDYYKYLGGANGEKFELEPVIEENAELGGGVSGKRFCHPIRAEINTIENL